jgi:transcriptional regulator
LIPTLATDFQIVGDEIQINDYSDRELIWSKIEGHCKTNSLDIAENLPGLIDRAITTFQNNAFSTLSLPKKFNPTTKYLLDKITMVIEDHLKTYNANISKIDTDPKAMIEILRISYNFVSDVNKLLALVINLCDLKPIILWLTISKYFYLDNKFKELPFGFSKKKASLSDYESVIKNARNKSFHQLFPFNKSLRFELDALEKVSVTIFSNHGKKDGNKMTYKDQELYDLLRSFTRVNEQVVSKNFWIKNEDVMKAVHELISATSEGIKITR